MAPHFDAMQPLKVSLPSSYTGSSQQQPACSTKLQGRFPSDELSSSQWATTVSGMAPFLDAEGLRRALTILDTAIYNVQRAKALENFSDQTSAGAMNGQDAALHFQNAAMCGMMQAQVQQQQQALYHELLQLPYMSANGPCATTNAALVTPSTSPPATQAASPLAPPMPAAPPGSLTVTPPTSESGGGNANGRRRTPQTLSTSLQILEEEDPECLLIVRRISKLGFKATRALKKHFSAYGSVGKVLLAHSTARQYCDQQFHVKRRPSNLGFVQMSSAEAVQKVLALGSSQEIEGVTVCVQKFEKHGTSEGAEEHGEAQDEGESDIPPKRLSLGKFERGMSEASTATSLSDA
jgi:hypothetical protein